MVRAQVTLPSAAHRPQTRLSRDDWVRAALDTIGEDGLAAVAVEPLARRLGVTKGSFYAHFASRDELIAAALESWDASHGIVRLEHFTQIADPRDRLEQLVMTAVRFSQSDAPSVHWSLLGERRDPRVRAAVDRVADARLELIESAYRELGLPPRRAAHRARLLQAAYIGLMHLGREDSERRIPDREIGRFAKEVVATLVDSA
jgi:AcrR family transcriptional regulator